MDVVDVSGYASLLSVLHGNNALWEIVKKVWDEYLANEHEQSPLPLFAIAIAFTEAEFEIPHRAILRTTWHQKINSKLSELPRREVFRRGFYGSDSVVDHESALIRIFAQGDYGSSYDGIDVFILNYLRNVEGGSDLDFGRKRQLLQEALVREEQSRQRQSDDDRGLE